MLGHSEVVFEAPTAKGPYTPCPINPILTQRDIPDADIRCTGHAEKMNVAAQAGLVRRPGIFLSEQDGHLRRCQGRWQ